MMIEMDNADKDSTTNTDSIPALDYEGQPYRTVKDSVFRVLFSDPANLLQLYQTLHPEDTESTAADLDIVTLETVIIKDIHNDLGFMVRDKLLILAEAQSLWSDNILIRGLLYMVKTYQNYFRDTKQSLYSTKRVKMPKPELYVIYTGESEVGKTEIDLSKDFFDGAETMINARMKVIVEGEGNDILNQYIIFTKVIDEQIRIHGKSARAVLEAIRICKDRNILKDFLLKHEKEAVDIMVELYTQKEAVADYVASERRESRQEGRQEGRAEGRTEGELAKAKKTAQKMFSRGDDPIDIAEILEVSIQQVKEWVGLVTV